MGKRPPDWSVIDGYDGGSGGRGGGVVPVVIVAVLIGLAVGAAWLWWRAPVVDSGPSGPIEWNAVQAVPTRAPDAQDVAWEKRGQEQGPSTRTLPGTPAGRTVEGQQIRVIDGDTFDIGGTRVRVAGIDAPETHPSRCANEVALGAAATQKLAALLRGGPLWISGNIIDRYGRSVRTVRVNGEDVADAMISAGLARNYDGKKRQGWC
jgi:micrococcal nuclease